MPVGQTPRIILDAIGPSRRQAKPVPDQLETLVLGDRFSETLRVGQTIDARLPCRPIDGLGLGNLLRRAVGADLRVPRRRMAKRKPRTTVK